MYIYFFKNQFRSFRIANTLKHDQVTLTLCALRLQEVFSVSFFHDSINFYHPINEFQNSNYNKKFHLYLLKQGPSYKKKKIFTEFFYGL